MSCYDEFAFLDEQARELGCSWDSKLPRREFVEVAPGRRLSLLAWGDGPPEIVLLHGGAQNAHTWDRVALLLDRPLVAVDLPGHGHSDWRDDRDYTPQANAMDVAVAVRSFAPQARAVVGMSIGGLTGAGLLANAPDLVRALVLVDVTPGSRGAAARRITSFVHGVPRGATFEQLVAYAAAALPDGDPVALRRGLRHNAVMAEDGSWRWRHHLGVLNVEKVLAVASTFPALWQSLARSNAPLMLVRASRSPAVADADVEHLLRLRPDARVELVADTGHSVQGDQPARLAALIGRFVPD